MVVGVLVLALLLIGTAAAQENGTAIADSSGVIQNLVGLGVWAFIGIGLIFAIVMGVAYVIGNILMYKLQEQASKSLSGTTRYGVEALVNLAMLRTVDESLDDDVISKLEKMKILFQQLKSDAQQKSGPGP